jgi:hypothetical protein
MGYLAETFGYGDDMPKRPPTPQLDPRAEEFQGQLYPAITSGLQGRGLTPEVNARSLRDTLASLSDSYLNFQGELPGFLARNIQREDVGVQDFLRKSSEAEYGRQWEGAQNDYAMQNFADIDAATQAAFGAVGAEKKLAGGITSAYNESMYRRAFAPDFESGLMGGAGGAAGTVMGSWKSGSQTNTPFEYYGQNNNSYGDPNTTRSMFGSSGGSQGMTFDNPGAVYGSPEQTYASNFSHTRY